MEDYEYLLPEILRSSHDHVRHSFHASTHGLTEGEEVVLSDGSSITRTSAIVKDGCLVVRSHTEDGQWYFADRHNLLLSAIDSQQMMLTIAGSSLYFHLEGTVGMYTKMRDRRCTCRQYRSHHSS